MLQAPRNRRIRRNGEKTELIPSRDGNPSEIDVFGELTETTEIMQSVDPRPSEIGELGEITEMIELIQSCDHSITKIILWFGQQ